MDCGLNLSAWRPGPSTPAVWAGPLLPSQQVQVPGLRPHFAHCSRPSSPGRLRTPPCCQHTDSLPGCDGAPPAQRLQTEPSACRISKLGVQGPPQSGHRLPFLQLLLHPHAEPSGPLSATCIQPEGRVTAGAPDFLPASHLWAFLRVLPSTGDALPPFPPTNFFSGDSDKNTKAAGWSRLGAQAAWALLMNRGPPRADYYCLTVPQFPHL